MKVILAFAWGVYNVKSGMLQAFQDKNRSLKMCQITMHAMQPQKRFNRKCLKGLMLLHSHPKT